MIEDTLDDLGITWRYAITPGGNSAIYIEGQFIDEEEM